MNRVRTHKGFTLAEVLVALMLLGVLASVLIPMMMHSVGGTKSASIVRTAASEIVQAYGKYSKKRPITADTHVNDNTNITALNEGFIIDQLNYVRIITNEDEGHQTSIGGVCRPDYPCALLQNGALLQYKHNAKFTVDGGSLVKNRSYVRFIVDPDGSGSTPATMLVLFYGGRISTWPAYKEQGGTVAVDKDGQSDDFTNPTLDPSYVTAHWLGDDT